MGGTGVIVRARGQGEKRWFFGGGVHTWKATAEETNGAFLFFEDRMEQGKMTPVHVHPDADEVFYVLEGEIVLHVGDGVEHRVHEGDFAVALRGVPHAFMATRETRLLCVQTPGTGQAFFRHASEPAADDRIDGPVDFDRVRAAANDHGGVKLLGPPPLRRGPGLSHRQPDAPRRLRGGVPQPLTRVVTTGHGRVMERSRRT